MAVVSLYGITSLILSLVGFYQSHRKRNAYGNFYPASIIGAFVWGDAAIFGLFWFLTSLFCLILNDWILFLLIFSLFWMVCSLGETIWCFLMQFVSLKRYPLEHFFLHGLFHDESILFVHQIILQCITVVSLLASLYFGKMWLGKI